LLEESSAHRASLCDSGLPDPDMCLVPEAEEEPPAHVPVRTKRRREPGLLDAACAACAARTLRLSDPEGLSHACVVREAAQA
jgi:hypothetical protein